MENTGKCPVVHSGHGGTTIRDWWPNELDIAALYADTPPAADPLGADFDYQAAFAEVDMDELKADVLAVMTDSQPWWPADWGNYGPSWVRMSWHSAGTYRIADGRGGAGGGQHRFAPINSWPDNVGLDKARRVLWPVKKKWGRKVSWADLIVLAGTVAQEEMGLPVTGFAGGRADTWMPEDMNWGTERTWLGDERYSGERDLSNPLAAVQMGLIYVNPEGPNGEPDPLKAAIDIRETFARMAMNDEETVALIAGGHTFGKTHGAGSAAAVGLSPEGAPIEQMGLGWKSTHGTGVGADTIGSGLEGVWTPTPTTWDNSFFDILFGFEWELSESPAGAKQWVPTDPAAANLVVDPYDPTKRHAPVMLTTDLSLRFDPIYGPISKRFHEDFALFSKAYADAWFKLTHRDMGPIERYVGSWVPTERFIWQDPVPAVDHPLVRDSEIAELKAAVLATNLTVTDLVQTAWASASTFRGTDKRGGANGARIRLAPQNQWPVNDPARLSVVLSALEGVQQAFNAAHAGGPQISLADLIVLAGSVAVEKAAADGGLDLQVPFTPGRTDATDEWTDADSFAVLEPKTDGFRNYLGAGDVPAERTLVDKAKFLLLSAPEMTVLVGGLRALGVSMADGAGVFTGRPGVLSNDFFVNVTDLGTQWAPVGEGEVWYEGRDGVTGDLKWKATRNDLIFGSNSILRALSEVYAADDAAGAFAAEFAKAWTKVMELDRYDLHR